MGKDLSWQPPAKLPTCPLRDGMGYVHPDLLTSLLPHRWLLEGLKNKEQDMGENMRNDSRDLGKLNETTSSRVCTDF